MGVHRDKCLHFFFMEAFEQHAFEQAPLKPLVYRRYVNDIFLIWQHGQVPLKPFIQDLNARYDSINFMVQMVFALS